MMRGWDPTWDQATLDRQYSPSSCVPSIDYYLQEYARLSADARQAEIVRTDLRYGESPDEVLDLFPSEAPDAPLQIFIHGGNWQELTKDSSAFAVRPFLRQGAAFAVVNYGLAPSVPLDEMISMICRSVDWLRVHASELGFNPQRMHLSGASAGAHLVAMALVRKIPEVAGVTLMSGMYDLEPVRHSYINLALRLDAAAARRNSPIHHLPSALPPVVIARGGNETDEYIRQHDIMVTALRERTRVVEVVEAGRNHFDLPYDLGVAGTALGDAVLAQMGLTDSGET
ncbi:alpha/beta hydrolase [Actinomycetes bacterium KLBMP 9797]